jgi:hypothetical protein
MDTNNTQTVKFQHNTYTHKKTKKQKQKKTHHHHYQTTTPTQTNHLHDWREVTTQSGRVGGFEEIVEVADGTGRGGRAREVLLPAEDPTTADQMPEFTWACLGAIHTEDVPHLGLFAFVHAFAVFTGAQRREDLRSAAVARLQKCVHLGWYLAQHATHWDLVVCLHETVCTYHVVIADGTGTQ